MATRKKRAAPESAGASKKRKTQDPALATTPRPSNPRFVDEPIEGKTRKRKPRILRQLVEEARERRRATEKSRPPEEGLSTEE